MRNDKPIYDLIVVGGSNGGMDAFMTILSGLSHDFQVPVVFVLHQQRGVQTLLPDILARHTHLAVVEPVDKEEIAKGHIYVAPPDYHLLIEPGGTFGYSYSEPINFSRPSIDMLFETAAEAYDNRVVGVLLTGANQDGAKGLAAIKNRGGLAVVQNPETARSTEMPQAGIDFGCNEHIINLDKIASYLNSINIDYLSKYTRSNG